jgi:hypothetical protein
MAAFPRNRTTMTIKDDSSGPPIQKCPGCLITKPVVSRHLIPAAIYDYCRRENASPIRVGDDVIMHTDRQVQTYLLCSDCEGVLNKGGEMWVNSKLARLKQGFPLYDLLTSVPPAFNTEGVDMYFAADNSQIDVEKLSHFAMGIFWKAAVHSWKARESRPSIQLGPYADAIRIWLRGESEFPKHVYLWVGISRPDKALSILSSPVEAKGGPWRRYWFHVPGAAFFLNVGKQVDAEMKGTCFHEDSAHPIFVSDEITGNLWARFGKDYRESRKTEGYLKARAKRASIK